jgi:hypothetical protein
MKWIMQQKAGAEGGISRNSVRLSTTNIYTEPEVMSLFMKSFYSSEGLGNIFPALKQSILSVFSSFPGLPKPL